MSKCSKLQTLRSGDVELFPGMARLWRPNYDLLWEGITISGPTPQLEAKYSWSEYNYNIPLNTLLNRIGLQKNDWGNSWNK